VRAQAGQIDRNKQQDTPSKPVQPEDSGRLGILVLEGRRPGRAERGETLRGSMQTTGCGRAAKSQISQMAYKAAGTARGRESVGNRNETGENRRTPVRRVGAGCRIGGGPEALFEA